MRNTAYTDVAARLALRWLETFEDLTVGIEDELLARVIHSNHASELGDPSQAPLLLDAWLQQRTAKAQQPTEETERLADILNGRELYDLPAIAEAAPREFMATVWPTSYTPCWTRPVTSSSTTRHHATFWRSIS